MSRDDKLADRLERMVRDNEMGRPKKRRKVAKIPQIPGKEKDWIKKVMDRQLKKKGRR